MLTLERVGARVTAPLAWSAEEVPGVDPAALAAQQDLYAGVMISVALVGRAQALVMLDEARKLALTADASTLAEARATLRAQLVAMDVHVHGVKVAGVMLDDPALSAEDRARLVDEAQLAHLLPDVASRARALQSPGPATKNVCVSAPRPNAGTSSTLANSTPAIGGT
jgi:hypothetical protein